MRTSARTGRAPRRRGNRSMLSHIRWRECARRQRGWRMSPPTALPRRPPGAGGSARESSRAAGGRTPPHRAAQALRIAPAPAWPGAGGAGDLSSRRCRPVRSTVGTMSAGRRRSFASLEARSACAGRRGFQRCGPSVRGVGDRETLAHFHGAPLADPATVGAVADFGTAYTASARSAMRSSAPARNTLTAEAAAAPW